MKEREDLYVEKRYKISGLSENLLKPLCRGKNVKDTYLSIDDGQVLDFMMKNFSEKAYLDAANIRISEVEGLSELIIRTGNSKVKNEYAIALDNRNLHFLKNNCEIVGEINKMTYRVTYGGLKMKINFYKSKPLTVAELGFETNHFSQSEIDKIAKMMISKIDSNAKVQDITFNTTYEDVNLAQNPIFNM